MAPHDEAATDHSGGENTTRPAGPPAPGADRGTWTSLIHRGRSRQTLDERAADEILGYGSNGLPG